MATPRELQALDVIWERLTQLAGFRTGPRLSSLLAPSLTTTEDQILYVDAALGADSNTGTQSQPFRSIQAAIDSLPKVLAHRIQVSVAAGSYAGFDISGFTVLRNPAGTPTGLQVIGTPVNAAVATGQPTGAVTSVAAGSTATATFAVWTDTGQAWTVNDLKGKYVEILTGTGAGSAFPILENTATTLTIPSVSATAGIGSTYAIRDFGTVVTTAASYGPSLPAPGAAAAAATPVGVVIQDNTGSGRVNQFRLDWIQVAMPAATTATIPFLLINNHVVTNLTRCRTLQGTVNNHVLVYGPAIQLTFAQCLFESLGTASVLVSVFGPPTGQNSSLSLTGCYFPNNANGIGLAPVNASMSNCQIECGIGISLAAPGRFSFSAANRIIAGGTSQAIRARTADFTLGGCYVMLPSTASLFISGRGSAVEIDGPHFFDLSGPVLGDTNTVCFTLTRGARCRISSTSTIAGTTEISLDGTSHTLAAMRAATPKHVKDSNYFTVAFE